MIEETKTVDENFSVLMSIYIKENPGNFDESMRSVTTKQTLQPEQVVLVLDGPLTVELESKVQRWKKSLSDRLTLVRLVKNQGLARALNQGLKECRHELVARMDTDDIALIDRFEKQVQFMHNNKDIAVSSGLIEEYSQNMNKLLFKRRLPLNHEDIVKFAKSRCPISHMAVMFRKSAVLAAGGYPLIYPEDYPLWCKMLTEGYRFANLSDILVRVRVGDALSGRRGVKFFQGEVRVFKYLHKIGFLTRYEAYRNIAQRGLVRLAPMFVKRVLYRYFR